MKLPPRLARFNRHVTNPIQRMWAGWAPSFAIIEHVGRRSGKRYRTPVNVFTARMRRNGKTFGIADPRAGSRAEAAQHVTRGRRIFARIPFEEAVLFTKTG